MRRLSALLWPLALLACGTPDDAAAPSEAAATLAPEDFDLPLSAHDGPRPVWQTDAERRAGKADEFDVRGGYQDIFGVTAPPAGPVRAVAEFETTDAVLVAWEGDLSPYFADVVASVVSAAPVYVITPDLGFSGAVRDYLLRQGVDTRQVKFFEFAQESFWTRDYGPIPVVGAQGEARFVDPVYYPDRRRNDAVPTLMSRYFGAPVSRPDLDMEGGNFMTDGEGLCVATEWLVEQNYPKSARQVTEIAKAHFGCDDLVILERLEGEGTGHVDMFAKFIDRDTVLLGAYDRRDDPTNAALLDRNAQRLTDLGLEVVRIPMPRPTYPVYRSYTNSLIVNDTVVVPTYRRDRAYESEALAAYRSAMPGYRIVTVDAEDAIQLGGAVHCVTMGFVLDGRGPVAPAPEPQPAPEPVQPEPEPAADYTSRPGSAIRDGYRTSDAIQVDAPGLAGELTVTVDIRHTYVGDLRVVLTHADKVVELHAFSGGDADNLQRSYPLRGFAELPKAGDWVLSVEDHYDGDQGTLASWSLSFSD